MREFRATWPDAPLTAGKNLERLRAFFAFCVSAGWLESNPAKAVKAPKAGKASDRVKVFTADELERIYAACDEYPQRNSFGHDNRARVKALVLVLRFSGLRIGDAVGLQRSQVVDGRILLRTAKTGEPVYVPVPKLVTDALTQVGGDGKGYFWTGNGLMKSAVADWQRALRRVFKSAKVTGNPHMFRHTLATDLLTKGVPIEDVAVLLGHATPMITARYYAHFVSSRRERLEERIRAVWS
jgi:integrase